MPLENRQDPAVDPLVSRPHRLPTPLMLAGVAGACLLGAGLGLWARPSDIERALVPKHVAPAAQPRVARRQIEIRVDGAAPPLVAQAVAAPPAVASPPVTAPAPAAAPKAPSPELLAPKPAPEGLMRVHAVAPPRLAETPRATPRLPAVSDLAAQAAAERRAKAAAQQAEAEARAERSARAAAEAVAAARKARLQKARIAAAAEAKAREKAELKVAAKKAADRRLAEKAAAARAQQTRLADAEAAKAARTRAALHLVESRRKAEAKTAPVRTASARTRCTSTDPGAALACADPALSAADRQLSRAYRQAQAAGVPSDRLERQQQRWLAARANAARQAPWAVHDIYLSRIAELQDQTREASLGD